MSRVSYAERTHTGWVRDHNEDAALADPQLGLWIIADGMGGHQGGEVASQIAVEEVHRRVTEGVSLEAAIQAAHSRVRASATQEEGSPGMGATVVALKLEGLDYELAWVGDSRAYLWDGQDLRQLSRDHSFVQTLLDSGAIEASEARGHPEASIITQAVGSADRDTLTVDLLRGRFLRNQQIILCTDGLSDLVPDESIASLLATLPERNEEERADTLLQAALDNGGDDNIALVLVSAPTDAPSRGGTAPLNSAALNRTIAGKSSRRLWGSRPVIFFTSGVLLALVASLGLYAILPQNSSNDAPPNGRDSDQLQENGQDQEGGVATPVDTANLATRRGGTEPTENRKAARIGCAIGGSPYRSGEPLSENVTVSLEGQAAVFLRVTKQELRNR